jgi:hypothetical protein
LRGYAEAAGKFAFYSDEVRKHGKCVIVSVVFIESELTKPIYEINAADA